MMGLACPVSLAPKPWLSGGLQTMTADPFCYCAHLQPSAVLNAALCNRAMRRQATPAQMFSLQPPWVFATLLPQPSFLLESFLMSELATAWR
jgi:hypothetical protein